MRVNRWCWTQCIDERADELYLSDDVPGRQGVLASPVLGKEGMRPMEASPGGGASVGSEMMTDR
jgi:hypothetical protein